MMDVVDFVLYPWFLLSFTSRWVRLLFGREFTMQDLLVLWDALFADGVSFDLLDYVFLAMLLYLRDARKCVMLEERTWREDVRIS